MTTEDTELHRGIREKLFAVVGLKSSRPQHVSVVKYLPQIEGGTEITADIFAWSFSAVLCGQSSAFSYLQLMRRGLRPAFEWVALPIPGAESAAQYFSTGVNRVPVLGLALFLRHGF